MSGEHWEEVGANFPLLRLTLDWHLWCSVSVPYRKMLQINHQNHLLVGKEIFVWQELKSSTWLSCLKYSKMLTLVHVFSERLSGTKKLSNLVEERKESDWELKN